MREEFYETSVGPEKAGLQKTIYNILKGLFILLVIVFIAALYFWLLTTDSGFVVIMMISSFFGSITLLIRRRLYLFYDYTYVSGEIRVIKVLNGKVRRRVVIFDAKTISQVGKTSSNSFKELSALKDVKKIIATPNGMKASGTLYYIYANVEGQQILLVLECDERLLTFIVSTRGKSIIEKDYK